jgi:hypothetical protein
MGAVRADGEEAIADARDEHILIADAADERSLGGDVVCRDSGGQIR